MTCTYVWLGDEWDLKKEDCEFGGCNAPEFNGSFIGEEVTYACNGFSSNASSKIEEPSSLAGEEPSVVDESVAEIPSSAAQPEKD